MMLVEIVFNLYFVAGRVSGPRERREGRDRPQLELEHIKILVRIQSVK